MSATRRVAFALAAALFSLSASANPAATPTDIGAILINPVGIIFNELSLVDELVPRTNAKRMAMGLPPKKPAFRHKRIAARQSPAPCSARTGIIRATTLSSDGPVNGFVYKVPNNWGEYGYTTNQNDALRVQFCAGDDPFDINTLNGIADYPHFGGVDGFANTSPDLNVGSFNYAYLAGVSQTPSGSPPTNAPNSFTHATSISESVESAIWTIGGDNVLTAHWVNSDSSKPATSIVYYPVDNVFVLSGDPGSFQSMFGQGGKIDIPTVTLTFVPA